MSNNPLIQTTLRLQAACAAAEDLLAELTGEEEPVLEMLRTALFESEITLNIEYPRGIGNASQKHTHYSDPV